MMRVPSNLLYREPLKTIPKHLLQGIGRVIVAHARLEWYMAELVSDIARIDYPIGRQIFRGDNPEALLTIILRLYDMWNIPRSDLGNLRKQVKKCYEKRNALAHGIWIRTKSFQLVAVREERMTDAGMLDRRILPGRQTRTVKSFSDDVRYIHAVTKRVRALKREVEIELQAWKRICPARKP